MQYEIFYLIGASKESELDKTKNEVEKIIKDFEGEFLEKETLEKRRLSYAVKHETHGIYVARRFELEKIENIKEITNKINLNGTVLRFTISKAIDLPELRSKEERMNELSQKESVKKSREESKPVLKEKPVEKKEKETSEKSEETEKEKTEKINEEDIDKKLEEILNI